MTSKNLQFQCIYNNIEKQFSDQKEHPVEQQLEEIVLSYNLWSCQ